MNKGGYDHIDEIISRSTQALSPEAFDAAANETDAVVLDIRSTTEFIEEHIPRSTFIGLAGGFAPWVGAVIVDVKQPILLVANDDQLEEAITRLSRVDLTTSWDISKVGWKHGKMLGMRPTALKWSMRRPLPAC